MNLRARIRSRNDLLTGLLFFVCGVATAVGAANYPLGTIRNIGPGYFPIILGILLALIGGAIAIQGLTFGPEPAAGTEPVESEEPDEGLALRPLIMVTAGVVAFGVLLRPFGLAIATLALVTLGSLGGRDFSLLRVVLVSAGLVVLCYFIFIYLLTLPVSLWPG